jgi:hypothetical protein
MVISPSYKIYIRNLVNIKLNTTFCKRTAKHRMKTAAVEQTNGNGHYDRLCVVWSGVNNQPTAVRE